MDKNNDNHEAPINRVEEALRRAAKASSQVRPIAEVKTFVDLKGRSFIQKKCVQGEWPAEKEFFIQGQFPEKCDDGQVIGIPFQVHFAANDINHAFQIMDLKVIEEVNRIKAEKGLPPLIIPGIGPVVKA